MQYTKVFVCLILLGFLGCSSTPKVEKPNTSSISTAEQDAPLAPEEAQLVAGMDSDSNKALGLQTVYFAYDSFVLDAEAKKVLNENAEVLKKYPTVKIQIEGHCDQRGGIQYNIALGEKRANIVRDYFLMQQGIDSHRLSIISYGKEKLLDPAENEQAYAKNRRGNFVIIAK